MNTVMFLVMAAISPPAWIIYVGLFVALRARGRLRLHPRS